MSSVGMLMKPAETSRMSKPTRATSLDVAIDGVGALGEDVLDETAGGDEHVVLVGDLEDLAQGRLGHQRERAAGELQRVDVLAHRVEHVLEVARSHHRVVGAADLGHAARARLWRAVVCAQERECKLVWWLSGCRWSSSSPSFSVAVAGRIALGAGSDHRGVARTPSVRPARRCSAAELDDGADSFERSRPRRQLAPEQRPTLERRSMRLRRRGRVIRAGCRRIAGLQWTAASRARCCQMSLVMVSPLRLK